MNRRNFILAAALAMASPAWAIDDGISLGCSKGFLWRPGDGCVKSDAGDGAGGVGGGPFQRVIEDAQGLIGPGPTLKCSDGYTALTYPGTWHWVCARDVREPK